MAGRGKDSKSPARPAHILSDLYSDDMSAFSRRVVYGVRVKGWRTRRENRSDREPAGRRPGVAGGPAD